MRCYDGASCLPCLSAREVWTEQTLSWGEVYRDMGARISSLLQWTTATTLSTATPAGWSYSRLGALRYALAAALLSGRASFLRPAALLLLLLLFLLLLLLLRLRCVLRSQAAGT